MNDASAPTQRIALSEEDVALLSDINSFEDGHITVLQQPYKLIKVVGRGFKGVVWKVEDRYSVPRALKLAIAEDYAGRSFHEEQQLRANLSSSAFPRCWAAEFWEFPATQGRRFVVTVEDWIPGVTLEQFLDEADPAQLTIDTLLYFGRGISGALMTLQSHGLVHDDLRPANVMLRQLNAGEAMSYGKFERQLWSVVLVDTGSLKKAENAKKDRDDVRWVAEHLISLHNLIRRRPNLTQTHLRFLREVVDIVEQMIDEPARGLRNADHLYTQLEAAHTSARTPPSKEPTLTSPFDFMSAERIADDELLINLFTAVPWMGQVAGPDPILLTGPRGCGKSMLFRWLGLRTHLASKDQLPTGPNEFTGIYVSCTTELQNRFLELKTPELAQRHRADIIHYFNLLLARELLITLDHVARHFSLCDEFRIGLSEQRQIMEFVISRVTPTKANLVGTSPLRIAIAAIERSMFESHVRLTRGHSPQDTTSTAFLGELTDMLTKTVAGLTARPIVFLLDDFSTHRVPKEVQRVLGPVVWERRASHVFKISSEKNGVVFDYQEGAATADSSREHVEIDVGKEYIDLSTRNQSVLNAAQKFAHDLLAIRLKLAGWAGTPEGLIGPSPDYPAWVKRLQESGKPPRYYGMTMIADLCSGDIATLLMIYRRVLFSCSPGQLDQVSAWEQDKAIRAVSTEMLYNLVPQRPLGPKMFKVATAFANFSGQAVIKGTPISGKPRECPRIEIDQGAETKTSLDPELRELLDELIRRSVFIELDPSRSIRGHVATLRLHLRRIYMPAFRGPLKKNDAVKFTPSQFEWFLTKPRDALQTQLRHISKPDEGEEELDFGEDDD